MRIKARTKETIAAYGFLAPNLIGFMVFTFIPVFISLILSFFKWDILTTPQFIGFENFSQPINCGVVRMSHLKKHPTIHRLRVFFAAARFP